MRPVSRAATALILGISMTAPTLLLTSQPAEAETIFVYTAVLNGPQENPPRDSPSQGVAQVLFVKESSTVCYRISYSPMTSPEILAHFHGPAAPSQNANILVDISPAHSPLGSPKHGCVPFTKDQAKLLSKGLVYINVHSTMFTGGEIRGQVLPTKVKYTKVPAPASPSGAFLE